MPGIDWKSQESFHRLLAATVAAMDGSTKLNYKRIADFYGEGATYDAIEGRFRVIKKQAAKLKEEVDNGRPIAPPRGGNKSAESTPRKPKTPRNHLSNSDGVMNGRVTKSTPNTPTKRRPKNSPIKQEIIELMSDPSVAASVSASSISTEAATPTSNGQNENDLINDASFASFAPFDAASFEMLAGAHEFMSQEDLLGTQNDWQYEEVA